MRGWRRWRCSWRDWKLPWRALLGLFVAWPKMMLGSEPVVCSCRRLLVTAMCWARAFRSRRRRDADQGVKAVCAGVSHKNCCGVSCSLCDADRCLPPVHQVILSGDVYGV